MPDVADLETVLNELFVGIPETELVRLNFLLDGLLAGRNDPGVYTGNVRCGIDGAFHDAAARRLGVSVAQLLGGPTRTRIRASYPIFRCSTEADVDRAEARVAELVADGRDCIRLYVGGNPDADEELVRRLARSRRPNVLLQAYDLSNKLDRHAAVALLRRLLAIWEPSYIESVAPVGDLRGMAFVRSRLEVRVSEHVGSVEEVIQLHEADAVDIVNVMPTALGGIRESLYQFQLCERLGLGTILSTTQSTSLGTALELQLGAAVVNVDYPTVSIGPLLYAVDPCTPTISYDGSHCTIPEGPGWGVEPDPEAVAACAAPLSWSGYGFSNQLPDRSEAIWKAADTGGLAAAGLLKH
jgi:muconate cycloisomerase